MPWGCSALLAFCIHVAIGRAVGSAEEAVGTRLRGGGLVEESFAPVPGPSGNEANETEQPTSSPEGAGEPLKEVRILHLSDTHNLHRSIEDVFPLPPADILIHSGDFTDYGRDAEFQDANAWLSTLKGRYKHILAITGNHDWIEPVGYPAAVTRNPDFWRQRLSHATLLLQENVTVMGLNIHGSSWKGHQSHSDPHGFGETPENVDILVTHGPALGIFDWCGAGRWGSSDELLSQVQLHKPKVHLFGHVHEQRGVWQRVGRGDKYIGGVEYEVEPGSGRTFDTAGPPPSDYPAELISNNAMMNHPGKEGWKPKRIAGPARLIIAQLVGNGWHFHT